MRFDSELGHHLGELQRPLDAAAPGRWKIERADENLHQPKRLPNAKVQKCKSERPRQACGPLARCFRAPCWPTASAEAGPQGYGASLGGRHSRLPPEFHVEMDPAGSADDLELDRVARLLRSDEVA